MSTVLENPMKEGAVTYKEADGIATITLNRPSRLNALDDDVARGLADAAYRAAASAAVRVIVVEAAGSSFMAGGDLQYFQQALDLPAEQRDAAFNELIDDAHSAIRTLRNARQPVIASIRGAVAGFGIGLVAACDLALAAENAFFKLAYSLIGATPDGGATYALPQTLGHKRAFELVALSDKIDAQRALQLGLVNWVVPESRIEAETLMVAQRLMQASERAINNSKRLLEQGAWSPLDEQLDAEKQAFVDGAASRDFAEGVSAFLQRRPPRFGEDQ